jgi:hypothetical protein
MGYVKGHSLGTAHVVTVNSLTESCNQSIDRSTEQIGTLWANDPSLVASMLSLDISRAFDNVSHEQLIYNIWDTRLPQ